ncbi:MAG: glutamine-hydrolyzing GMP synthase, partial [Ruminococcus sp.]|nr:glutamine-hydrolyzing GMP synthase [Ruminococcus sp.]
MNNQLCIVLDFGGQYNQLIARRVRDAGVYCEIKSHTTPIEELKALNPMGIIFTGGPNSVYVESSPHISKEIFDLNIPILGICYGCQIVAYTLGGEVSSCTKSEYGKIEVSHTESILFKDVPEKSVVWMSHTDYVSKLPEGFKITAKSDDCPAAAFENPERKLYAVQFHPEVTHSEYGKNVLHNFLYQVCGFAGDWKMDNFIDSTVAKLREEIGDKNVILGLSGGVDSSVAAGLLSRAVGKQLTCVFVDQGLMRKD